MEFIGILKVLRRWIWLLIIIVIPTPIFIFVSVKNVPPTYNARVTIEVITPDQEDVAVFYERNYISDRDLVSITLNQFIEVTRLSEVKNRTLTELNIDEDYELNVNSEIGSDFVFINTIASTPELAQIISNTHSKKSIEYFGELRAQPLDKSLIYFQEQVNLAKQELSEAEQSLVDFELNNDIGSVEMELDLHNTLLERSLITQVQHELESIASPVNGSNSSDAEIVAETIETYRQNLINIALLEPKYNELLNDIAIAEDKYDRLSTSFAESDLKASFARQAFFIQIIKPASLPQSAVGSVTRPVMFGTFVSFAIAILLIFLLEYVFPSPKEDSE